MFTVPPTEENATRQLHVHLVTRDTIVYEIRELHILNLYSEDCSHIMSFYDMNTQILPTQITHHDHKILLRERLETNN